jgi:lipid-A-disaccharide synthase
VYYISPQVWAWRKYRIKKIKARIDHMLVFFPFEESFYKQHNVRVTQVGHPLIDQISHSRSKREPELDSPRLALLPGSRASELKRHTPLLLEVIQGITERYPKAQFQIPVAPTLKESSEYDVFRGLTHVQLTSNTAETLEWSDVAAVASGTATLETALTETPFCLFYRMSSSSYWFGRRVFGYRGFFGLPNFILGKEAAREFIQDQAEAEMILEELIRLLEDGPYRRGHISQIKEVRKCLGPEGASRKAAQEVYRWLEPSLSNSTPSSPRPNIQ